jgi:indolepyruvate ferredoxin oxidoreductase alpha subunit
MKTLEEFLVKHDRVLVVEELEPFIERQVAAMAHKKNLNVEILGKELVSRNGELNVSDAMKAVGAFLDIGIPPELENSEKLRLEMSRSIVPRPPILCAGCGHRNAFFAINIVERKLKRRIIKPSDIGCYTLGYFHPLSAVDLHFCMGASIGVSTGLSKALDDYVVCTIGDSTFFHAGIPALINAVFNEANITVVVLDNETTAMTGHQVHPGVGLLPDGSPAKKVMIEDVVKACGVESVKVVDVFDLDGVVDAIVEGVNHKGVSVVIARGPCMLVTQRSGEAADVYKINQELCTCCKLCVDRYGCPAIRLQGDDVVILEDHCSGCGVCAHQLVCPSNAIERVEHE